MAKYEPFRRIELEQPVDPHSAFWLFHEKVDEHGDPLDLLIRAEEGDEIAQEVVKCLSLDRRSESRRPQMPSAIILRSAKRSAG